MSRLGELARAELSQHEQLKATFEGLTGGLGAPTNAMRNRAVLCLGSKSLAVAHLTNLLRAKLDRIELSEIVEVIDTEHALTGLPGAVARKNESHAVARALGASSQVSCLLIRTRRGELIFELGRGERGAEKSRDAYVAVTTAMSG